MKNWEGPAAAEPQWEALHQDGRPAAQVQCAVRAPSLAAAARFFSASTRYVRTYMSETECATTLEALDLYPSGTVLVAPLDPGDTVKGQDGWVQRYGT